jgi:hypothetical protein
LQKFDPNQPYSIQIARFLGVAGGDEGGTPAVLLLRLFQAQDEAVAICMISFLQDSLLNPRLSA